MKVDTAPIRAERPAQPFGWTNRFLYDRFVALEGLRGRADHHHGVSRPFGEELREFRRQIDRIDRAERDAQEEQDQPNEKVLVSIDLHVETSIIVSVPGAGLR